MDMHGACSQDIRDTYETGIAAIGLQDGHTYEDQPEEPEEHAAFGNEHGEPQDGDTCEVDNDHTGYYGTPQQGGVKWSRYTQTQRDNGTTPTYSIPNSIHTSAPITRYTD